MAKRGRPKKDPSDAGTIVKTTADLYCPDYTGRKWWLLGIKTDPDRNNHLPFHNNAFGGIAWQHGTQNQVIDDGWLGLDRHRRRLTRQILSSAQVRRAVVEIRQKVVRWIHRVHQTSRGTSVRWAASILSLEHRTKTLDRKKQEFVPAGHLYHPGPNDEPVSRYLVFLPRSRLEEFGLQFYDPDLEKFPAMLELDPSLIPDRMKVKDQEVAAGDEPW